MEARKVKDQLDASDSEDEYLEIQKMQQERAKKLAEASESSDNDSSDDEVADVASGDESSEMSEDNLGAKLFGEKKVEADPEEIRALLEDGKQMLESFSRLENKRKELRKLNPRHVSYIKNKKQLIMVYQLYMSYCAYSLMEGKKPSEEVMAKIAHVRQLIDGLHGLEERLNLTEPDRIPTDAPMAESDESEGEYEENEHKPDMTKVETQSYESIEEQEDVPEVNEDEEPEFGPSNLLSLQKPESSVESFSDNEEMAFDELENMIEYQEEDLRLPETGKKENPVGKLLAKVNSKKSKMAKQKGQENLEELSEDEALIKKQKKKKREIEEFRIAQKEHIEDKMERGEVNADDMYAQQLAKVQRKRVKKAERKVEEKKETFKELGRQEEEIQRNVNYDIKKARGMYRKKKKEDRNPRVKRRNQYARKLKERQQKGVIEFKEGPQGLYDGEKTGIRSNFDRGTKF